MARNQCYRKVLCTYVCSRCIHISNNHKDEWCCIQIYEWLHTHTKTKNITMETLSFMQTYLAASIVLHSNFRKICGLCVQNIKKLNHWSTNQFPLILHSCPSFVSRQVCSKGIISLWKPRNLLWVHLHILVMSYWLETYWNDVFHVHYVSFLLTNCSDV